MVAFLFIASVVYHRTCAFRNCVPSIKLCTSRLYCVCVRDVGPSPFNYLFSLDKAFGIHCREKKFNFFNIIRYERNVTKWSIICNCKIFYDTSTFKGLSTSTIDKVRSRWLVALYVNNFNRDVSRCVTNSITHSFSFSNYRWVICWTLVEMKNLLTPWSEVLLEKLTGFAANQEIPRTLWNPKVHYHLSMNNEEQQMWTVAVFIILMHHIVFYCITNKLQYAVQRKTTKTYSTVWYGIKMLCWSLTLREEHRPKVFENRVLRRIFGPKRDVVTGEWRKLHMRSLILCTRHPK